MKHIILKEKVALVDDEDFERVSRYKWCAYQSPSGTWYARRSVYVNGVKRQEWLHRVILSADSGEEVDHRDHDGLNCQRHNLRLATTSQNRANVKIRKDNKAGYKGITSRQTKSGIRWYPRICVQGKQTTYGGYSTKEEAARAYDALATQRFGEFACLNFSQPATAT